MIKLILFLSVILLFCCSIEASVAKFAEKTEVYDEEHLKMHVEEIDEKKKMSEEDERFHYFDLHDLNKDSHIDGVELWKAVHHNHKEDEKENKMSDEEMEKLVDEAFKEIDIDGDGLISYPEYLKKLS